MCAYLLAAALITDMTIVSVHGDYHYHGDLVDTTSHSECAYMDCVVYLVIA